MAGRRRRVVWTPGARDGLDESLAFIAEDSPQAAERVLEVVLDAADSLQILAHRGRVVPEIADEIVREVFVFSYRLMYEIAENEVRILAFVHGARDFGLLLRQGKGPRF
jgi:toxin ParE1/3/4